MKFLVFIAFVSVPTSCTLKEEIMERLLEDYDNKILPQLTANVPVHVKLRLNILGMKSTTKERLFNHYSSDLIIQQSWEDHRLKHDDGEPLTLSGDVIELFWRPDTRALTEKASLPTQVLKSNKLIQIYGNGTVVTSQRCSLVNYCKMDFATFPFDQQECELRLESYAFSNNFLTLSWMDKDESKSFRVVKDPDMEEFIFKAYRVYKEEYHYDGNGSGTHDQLVARLIFQRPTKFYLVRLYLPVVLIVILSWLSFWIDYRSVPARTSIGITTVLTFVQVRISIFKRDVPAGKEINFFDIYSQVCFIFVLMVLIEYSVAQSIDLKYRLMDWYRVRQDDPNSDVIDYEDTVENGDIQMEFLPEVEDTSKQFDTLLSKLSMDYLRYKHAKHQETFHILDKVSKIVFPLCFLIFNLIYAVLVSVNYSRKFTNLDNFTEVVWT
ncbi:gamma-aminobutyric acid receptor subunit pi-like [Hydractinia symbiolongicarpus]|uniref:gamma-aminobutyric acid receptor subunit pi-like n=1 Tax=Hydractinia symbiolongicarpus TaxID=13093 RepID=UPI00254A2C5C|nr:gamma-aminobutyric acid receptor subunit pi-like [Hydractinia symbiolongicarpus]